MKSGHRYIQFLFVLCIYSCLAMRCGSSKIPIPSQPDSMHPYTNHLIHQSSPYLLQHAHNPVDWYPWGDEALAKAKRENKLLIISIGYAACHWCHVMERESFEDSTVARLMNEKFVCIKVDREERPDIDQVYMTAVQLLTGRGGWPLNAIALPDGRPIHGGTYFPKNQWMEMLEEVHKYYVTQPEKSEEYARALAEGIATHELISSPAPVSEFTEVQLDSIVLKTLSYIDFDRGGFKGAPKFPLPVAFEFLLRQYHHSKNDDELNAVLTTLDRMCAGGIYDHVGGGFARYSVDDRWLVPHFEKMLYDNAQLVSLYSSACQLTKDKQYKNVVYETLQFISRELTDSGGGFYSALDADSEGEEGKFYVWTKKEFEETLGYDELKLGQLEEFWNITASGNWEHEKNILHTEPDKQQDDLRIRMDVEKFQMLIAEAKQKLLAARNKRVRPLRDEKILTSWNAMMCKAYIDAYRVFDNPEFLNAAEKNMNFILREMKSDDNRLNRNFMRGKSSINAFLDDYAFTIEALIALYQATFNEAWLNHAGALLQYTMEHFSDEESSMFFFTSDIDPALVARKMELTDGVIPASNSVMAKNLFVLGHFFAKDEWIARAKQMLMNVKPDALLGAYSYANWDILMNWFVNEPYEIAITGTDALAKRKEFDKHFLPGVLFCGVSKSEDADASLLPLLENKWSVEPTIYVCRNKTCRMPVKEVEDALGQME